MIRNRLTVELPHLHPNDQGQVLVLADADTPADEPLLSALFTTNNGNLHPCTDMWPTRSAERCPRGRTNSTHGGRWSSITG